MGKNRNFTDEQIKNLPSIEVLEEKHGGVSDDKSAQRKALIVETGKQYLFLGVFRASFVNNAGALVEYYKCILLPEGHKEPLSFKNFVPLAQNSDKGRMVGDSTNSANAVLRGKVVEFSSVVFVEKDENGNKLEFPFYAYEWDIVEEEEAKPEEAKAE